VSFGRRSQGKVVCVVGSDKPRIVPDERWAYPASLVAAACGYFVSVIAAAAWDVLIAHGSRGIFELAVFTIKMSSPIIIGMYAITFAISYFLVIILGIRNSRSCLSIFGLLPTILFILGFMVIGKPHNYIYTVAIVLPGGALGGAVIAGFRRGA